MTRRLVKLAALLAIAWLIVRERAAWRVIRADLAELARLADADAEPPELPDYVRDAMLDVAAKFGLEAWELRNGPVPTLRPLNAGAHARAAAELLATLPDDRPSAPIYGP